MKPRIRLSRTLRRFDGARIYLCRGMDGRGFGWGLTPAKAWLGWSTSLSQSHSKQVAISERGLQ